MHCRFARGISVTSFLLSRMFLHMVKLQQEDLNTKLVDWTGNANKLHVVQGIIEV